MDNFDLYDNRTIKLLIKSISILLISSVTNLSYAQSKICFLHQKISNNTKGQSYLLQVGSFKVQKNALNCQSRINKLTQYPVSIRHSTYYKVLVGPIDTLQATQKIVQDILASQQIKPQRVAKILVKNPVLQADAPLIYPELKEQPVKNLHWFGTVGGGAQWSQSKSSMTVPNGSHYPSPQNVDLFSIQNHTTEGLFFLSAGRRWQRDNDWFSAYSLGVYYQYLAQHNLNGTITQYSQPEYLNYSYQWGSSSNVVLLSGKLNLYQAKQWSPYITAAIGAGINHTRDYSESAFAGVTNRVSPAYSNGTSTNFAYQAGLGLDYQFSPVWTFGIGYLYQNVGDIESGAGKSTWAGTHLSLGSLSQNELVASITYLF